ncbi:C4-type zinc ribbon domain-containing protein [Cryobacterium sp. PH31-AA6]|uniref:zinc ribbon domain-containing protein n=1 Tax=Cryobacterium sp. PH31-AA6 TaxID=3046205 RepID=UPI0024B91CBE|nr:C4-type zinc ribbon domain-containing protein [Cryobacterium sp. PH31-AA6]MDJ0322564.1 C4-type zinc ribbon domain-containing protein [Cryobacterium sp. PH31-AA6]
MKASPAEQKELLRLQALDIRLQQVEYQTKSLSQHAELRELSGTMEKTRMTLGTRTGAVEDIQTELHRIESDVDVVEKRIARDSDRVQHTSSVKDVQALETELTSLRKRLLALEEIEIAVMERLEEAEAAVAKVEVDRDAIAVSVAEAEQARDLSLADLNRQLGELRRDRAAIAGSIADDLAALYEKRFVSGRGNAAALLRARTCSGCTITLTGSDLDAVRSAPADDVLFCPDCGAILVRTEESGI